MKKVSKNMLYSILCKIVYIITGFIVQRKILAAFGSSVNGLTSTIAQVISYISLLEAGLGSASIQALYNPLSRKDKDGVNSIMSATNRQYKLTGYMFCGLLVAIAAVLPFVAKGEIVDPLVKSRYLVISLMTLLTGMSSFISYLYMGKYTVLLTANQNIAVIYKADIVMSLISCFGRIGMILLGADILLVQTVVVIAVVVKILILHFYAKSKYKWLDLSVAPDNSKISKRWSVLIHQIAGMVVNHTDVLLLTIFSTLSNVSIYNVYNYVFSNLHAILTQTFSNAPLATFGLMLQKDDKSEFNHFYQTFELLFTIMLFIVMVTSFVMILPFVTLYTKGVTDTVYIPEQKWIYPVLFCLTGFMNTVRIPTVVSITAAGHFRETQRGAIIEAVINLVVSLALIKPLGIAGLLIGTVASFVYRTLDVIIYSYRHIFTFGPGKLIRTAFINTAIALAICVIDVKFIDVTVTGWLDWLVKATISFVTISVSFLAANLIFNYGNTRHAIGSLLSSVTKKLCRPRNV